MFIILFILPINCPAQHLPDNIQFNHFSADHGLSQTIFSSILQDKKGYMWFGTTDGLIKFDGYRFTTFRFDPLNENSIQSNNANNLCQDTGGNIWIADVAVSKYDQHTGNFITWRHDVKNKFSPPSDNETCLLADKLGKIWIGTFDAGVFFYETGSDKFITLSEIIYPDTLCSQNINCLMMDHNGLLWIGTENGINIYDGNHKKLTLFDPDKKYAAMNKTVRSIMEDHSGDIWVSLWMSGIYRYTPSTGVSKIYQHSNNDPNSLSNNLVRTLMEDSSQSILAGTSFGGLCVYQRTNDNFKTYRADINNTHALSSDQIISLFEDRSGVIWIGTGHGGLNTFSFKEKKFIVYQNWDKDYVTHWPESLYKNHKGQIYMTTHGTGLQEFDPENGKFISYNVVLPHDSLSFANIGNGALEASDGNIWTVTYAEGLHKYNLKTRKFTTIHSTSDGNHISMQNPGNCIAEDFNKRLWMGTAHGLKCYDLKTKTFSGFEKKYHDTNLLSIDNILSLYMDSEGVLWVAGFQTVGSPGGLTLFNTKTGRVQVFLHDDKNSHSISNNLLSCFYDDGNGTVWIGTYGGGLNRFDKKSEQFVAYTMKEGLPDNEVNGILPDEYGNLWLSGNKGICKFTPPSKKNTKAVCRNYNMSDGLPGNEYNRNSCVKANDGTLYFAGIAGLVAFKPDELKDNNFIPPVVITDFSVFNKSIVPNDSIGILKLPADETKEITLSYKQNDFSFAFAALSYVHPEKNQYAYILEGFDKDWIYTDATRRFANYTNLDARTYTFKVKGSNNDGVWNETPVEIKLIITPPWWQTLWFNLLCVFAAGIILYAIYNNRMQKMRDIRRIRNKIASDLHDDLGATLSSISIMSELVNQQVKDKVPQASSILEKIGSSSRNMIESVNDMVWAINPQNDSFENIIKRMRTFASEILSAKDIAFHFDFDKNLLQSKLKMEMRRNFYLIFKEAVNNVAKYSHAANASVMIWNRENNLKMTIRDDGNGFELGRVKAGNGLLNMQQRADGMKARFNLESIPGKGTIIELEFKNE